MPIVLYVNWELVTPHLDNPFAHFLFISNRLPDSTPDTPYYAKSYWVLPTRVRSLACV